MNTTDAAVNWPRSQRHQCPTGHKILKGVTLQYFVPRKEEDSKHEIKKGTVPSYCVDTENENM